VFREVNLRTAYTSNSVHEAKHEVRKKRTDCARSAGATANISTSGSR